MINLSLDEDTLSGILATVSLSETLECGGTPNKDVTGIGAR